MTHRCKISELDCMAFRLADDRRFQDACRIYAHGSGSSAQIMKTAIMAIQRDAGPDDEACMAYMSALRRAIYGKDG